MEKHTWKKWPILCLLCIGFILVFSGCFAQETGSNYQGESIDPYVFSSSINEDVPNFLAERFDNYSAYFTEQEFNDLVDDYLGYYSGVGIYMTQDTNNTIVFGVMRGQPAAEAGIQTGDIILAVDGKSVAGMDMDMVASLVKGQEDTEVTLRVIHPVGTQEDITITRRTIEVKSVEGCFLEDYPGIAYISIYDFTENTPIEFTQVYQDLLKKGEIKGIILDLRNNGGGSLGASLNIASAFVPKGQVVFWQKKSDSTDSYTSKDGSMSNIPVVALQNGGSASASEVLIGALRDNGIAQTVGEKTYGKGITQAIISLDSGAALRYTESRYLTPNKYDLNGKGLEPDYQVSLSNMVASDIYSLDPAKDAQLKKAIEVMQQTIGK